MTAILGLLRAAAAPSTFWRLRRRLVVLGALAATFAAPQRVLAHGSLRSSDPAAGARLRAVPRTLRLVFTETPQLAFSRIVLRGPDGREVALAPIAVAPDDPKALVTTIRGPITPGTYTVAWQMGGSDGHPVRDQFTFVVEPGATAGPPATGDPGATAGTGQPPAPRQAPAEPTHHDPESMPEGSGFGAESPLYAAIRWLQYTGLLVAVGAAAFATLVLALLRRTAGSDSPMLPSARSRAARLGLWATALVGLSAMLRLVAQSYAMNGPEDALSGAMMGTMIGQTSWGRGWLLQLAAVVVAAAGFALARRGSRAGWTLASLGTLSLAFTPALASHAAASPRLPGLAVVADGLHVLGAGGWLGSLTVMLLAGIPAALALAAEERGRAVADLVNAFSPAALAFAGLVAATGVFAAWLHVGSVPALWQTTYGKLLLGKLAVLSVVAGTGAYNWLRVRPSLGSAEAAARIRRSSTLEVLVGVLVLIITAILVATPTGADMDGMGM